MATPNAFCHFCGTPFSEPLVYPRTCTRCRAQVWANPIPVCVALVPIVESTGTGLLVIRRAIQPGIGKLALAGGFLEEHEDWQVGCAREVREETAVIVDPRSLEPFWYASSAPNPNRVMLFAVAPAIAVEALPPFAGNQETSERGVIFGAGGLEEVFAFATHTEAVRRYFAARGPHGSIAKPHGFTPR